MDAMQRHDIQTHSPSINLVSITSRGYFQIGWSDVDLGRIGKLNLPQNSVFCSCQGLNNYYTFVSVFTNKRIIRQYQTHNSIGIM